MELQEITEKTKLNVLIIESFNKVIERYNSIFSQYYPAHDSTGFTERNLTCNFAESLKYYLGEESFIWYESPVNPKNKKEHIDAVVFSKKHNSVLLIETKRLGQTVNSKIVSLKKDIDRVDSEINNYIDNISYITNNLNWKDKSTNIFVLFICDYWFEKGKNFNDIENNIKDSFVDFEILAKKGFPITNAEDCLKNYSFFLGYKKLEL
jgi:hypothetical protein